MRELSSKDLKVVPTFTELDYIANTLYQMNARKSGYPAGVRWWCLREDKRVFWRNEARHQYLEWSRAEQIQLDLAEST